ncbi:MAG: hypothetical protein Q8Q39_00900, partial [bacterium]|nr:hypothetical protein [bacterium]
RRDIEGSLGREVERHAPGYTKILEGDFKNRIMPQSAESTASLKKTSADYDAKKSLLQKPAVPENIKEDAADNEALAA